MCDVISVRFSHHALALFGKENASVAQGRLVIHAIYRRRVISSFDPHGKVFVADLCRHRRPLPPLSLSPVSVCVINQTSQSLLLSGEIAREGKSE